jgi:hypothetical protein
MFKRFHIHDHELGLLFRDGAFRRVLEPGRHWFFDPFRRIQAETVQTRTACRAELVPLAALGLLTHSPV